MIRRTGFALAAALASAASLAHAEHGAAPWLRERVSVEWMVGTGGWRSGLGFDARVPGFEAVAAGTELDVSLDLVAGLGLFLSGRVLAGGMGDAQYLEGLGGLGLQLRVNDRVRLRAGAAAGQATLHGDSTVLVGGSLAGYVDLFAFGRGRLTTTLGLRLDIDGHVHAALTLPEQSFALAVGLGLRY